MSDLRRRMMILVGEDHRVSVSASLEAVRWHPPQRNIFGDFQVHDHSSVSSVRHDNHHYAVFVGKNKQIYFSSSADGLYWSKPALILSKWKTNGSAPNLAVLNNVLYIVLLGEDRTISYASSSDNGESWVEIGSRLFNGWKTSGSTPSLFTTDNTMYMVFLGENNSINLECSNNGGKNWAAVAYNVHNGWQTNGSTPTLVEHNEQMFMVRLGKDRTIHFSSSGDGGHNWADYENNILGGWKTSGATPNMLEFYPFLIEMACLGEDKTVTIAKFRGGPWSIESSGVVDGWKTNGTTPSFTVVDPTFMENEEGKLQIKSPPPGHGT